jgi:hypothetical protein
MTNINLLYCMICMLNIRCSSLKFAKYIFLIGKTTNLVMRPTIQEKQVVVEQLRR